MVYKDQIVQRSLQVKLLSPPLVSLLRNNHFFLLLFCSYTLGTTYAASDLSIFGITYGFIAMILPTGSKSFW